MTAGSAKPVLVLGLGNLLLGDDGVGLRLLDQLAAGDCSEDVEFIDGGTQGLALLGYLEDRELVVVLDAIQLGDPPGTIHVVNCAEIERMQAMRSSTSHESNALELLAYARLLGWQPRHLVLVGIEPESTRTGIGLSASVEAALPIAIECARSQMVCV